MFCKERRSMVYLKTFQLNEYRSQNQNLYPFNVLKEKEPYQKIVAILKAKKFCMKYEKSNKMLF